MSKIILQSILVSTVIVAYLGKKVLDESVFLPWYSRYLKLPKPDYPTEGICEDDYKQVEEVFKDHFDRGLEVGASVVVYNKGTPVVELYGGYQDFGKRIAYTSSTLNIVFSSSKFMVSAVIARLVDQGLLDYDEKISTYWPEFGNGNKGEVTLADVLRHEGGVPFLMNPEPTYEEVYDTTKLKIIIANTPHEYDGKKVRCYHGITRGLILNEIVKTVDKKRRSIGQLFKEEINPEYNMEFYLGLEEKDSYRRARWYSYPILDMLTLFLPKWLLGRKAIKLNRGYMKKDSDISKIMKLKISKDKDLPNAADMITIELPSVNGHTNAKSLAYIASFFANNRQVCNERFISESGVKESIPEPTKGFDNAILENTEMTKGGFGIFRFPELGEYSDVPFYGWGGMGGSCVLFSPEYNFSFAYAMNAHHLVMMGEGRATNLLVAAFNAHIKNISKN
ncbi:beta-lactamase/transpeptidase-like protein [Neoconidiobolus thromboides FSU 785]|nr:beta-lactamase/transpeptidase-like protein [Neoconidiobolus thromboides FSU 785]